MQREMESKERYNKMGPGQEERGRLFRLIPLNFVFFFLSLPFTPPLTPELLPKVIRSVATSAHARYFRYRVQGHVSVSTELVGLYNDLSVYSTHSSQ